MASKKSHKNLPLALSAPNDADAPVIPEVLPPDEPVHAHTHFECKYDAGARIDSLERRMGVVEQRVQAVEGAVGEIMNLLTAQGVVQEDIRGIVKKSEGRMQEVVTAININSEALARFMGPQGDLEESSKPLTVRDLTNWKVQVLARLNKWGIIVLLLPEIIHQITVLIDVVAKVWK